MGRRNKWVEDPRKKAINMNPSYLLVLLGVAMVSYSGPLVKVGLNFGANPASIAMMRMALSALILLPIMCVRRKDQKEAPIQSPRRMTVKQWLWSLLASAFLALHYLTWMTSLDATSTFASVALVCTQPLFVAALSGIVLKEKMPKAARPGAAVAVAGALLIGMNSIAGMSGDITGDLLALAGAVLMAGHWLCNRYARRTVDALPFMVLLYTQTAALLALTLPFLGGFQLPWPAFWCVVGLAVGCTLLGHSVFTLALGKVSATVVSFALLGEPVGAMLWSYIMFDKVPAPLVFTGGMVIIAGLALYLMGSSGLLKRKHSA
jgi:drug/metabolite transporter (DMT)-like permease